MGRSRLTRGGIIVLVAIWGIVVAPLVIFNVPVWLHHSPPGYPIDASPRELVLSDRDLALTSNGSRTWHTDGGFDGLSTDDLTDAHEVFFSAQPLRLASAAAVYGSESSAAAAQEHLKSLLQCGGFVDATIQARCGGDVKVLGGNEKNLPDAVQALGEHFGRMILWRRANVMCWVEASDPDRLSAMALAQDRIVVGHLQ
jgi:hypothetical protein